MRALAFALVVLLAGCAGRAGVHRAWSPRSSATNVAPPPGARAKEIARRLFREGMAHLEAHEYAYGIADLEAAYFTLPHPNVAFNLGRAYLERGDARAAIRWLRVYVASNPEDRLSIEREIRLLEEKLSRRCDTAC